MSIVALGYENNNNKNKHMKNSILLVFTFCILTVQAQEFKTTEKYALANERSTGQEEEGSALIDVMVSSDTSNPVATIKIDELELFEGIQITVLPNPGLEKITEILKVTVEYAACCSGTQTYYFLVSDEQEFTELPLLENVYCDTTLADTHYIFPSQEFGREGTVLQAELHYTEKYTIKDIKVLQSFVWNDDDFDYEDAITANER